jgi:hypothetical protein
MFDFRNIHLHKKAQITVDDRPYDSRTKYTQVNRIKFSNDNGDLTMEGRIIVRDLDLAECIKLEPFALKFSSEFKVKNSLQFNDYNIAVKFKNASRFARLSGFLSNLNRQADFNQAEDTLTIYLNTVEDFKLNENIDAHLDSFSGINQQRGGKVVWGIDASDHDILKKFKDENGQDIEISVHRGGVGDLEEEINESRMYRQIIGGTFFILIFRKICR